VAVKIFGTITNVERIARGPGIRVLTRLKSQWGGGNWRKLKGIARVEAANGVIRRAEVHYYEAHGVGKRDMKVKMYLD
jgi:hypothetical protein